jgi:3-methyladenine DNA glycosylase AlkC
MSTPTRKGASRRADVPRAILAQLNAGEIEAVTLAEILSIDFTKLLHASFPTLAKEPKAKIDPALGIIARMNAGGTAIVEHLGPGSIDDALAHRSDTVRGWACAAIGQAPKLTLAQRLKRIRPLADDPNPGVREWAWIFMRPHVIAHLDDALKLLEPWTGERSANLRRYASEITRPRGVWCAHIAAMKTNPALGLPIIEPLSADDAKYVQLSVGNWLNDAGKHDPDWVRALCKRWAKASPSVHTSKIIKRATRNLA